MAKATDLVQKYKDSEEYIRNNYRTTWENCWKVYNLHRIKKNYAGISDHRDQETFTIVESLVANIGGGTPKFDYLPTNELQDGDTDILNQLADFYWDQMNMGVKSLSWIRDFIMFGNGVLKMSWNNGMPEAKNIPLWDFFFDPAATNPDNARYMGYRYLTTLDELKKETVINPETGETEPKYKNLSKIKSNEKQDDEGDKATKERLIGSTLSKKAQEGQVEVLYFEIDDRLVEVANRSVVIRDIETPFQRKAVEIERERVDEVTGDLIREEIEVPAIPPYSSFVILRNYVDPSLFLARGDVEMIMDSQEKVNDLESQKQDNITYVMDNMWAIDPQFADMAPEIESIPGAVYPIPVNALRPLEKPVVTQDADIQIISLKETMRRATAADEIIQGVSQESGRVTATEVQAQVNQANQRFSTKLSMLENEGFAHFGSVLMKLIQTFVTEGMLVRVAGPEGTEFLEYDPLTFIGDFDPKVRLEATARALKAEEGQKFQQVYQLLFEDPGINQLALREIALKKMFDLTDEQVKRLLDVPPEQMAMGMEGLPQPGSPTPSAPLPTPGVIQDGRKKANRFTIQRVPKDSRR